MNSTIASAFYMPVASLYTLPKGTLCIMVGPSRVFADADKKAGVIIRLAHNGVRIRTV
jgi:hypothetical protein